MKAVSVIIPVYNVEKYLKRCLESVINQTYDNYEIICVNDCSPDNCQKILEEYSKKYPGLIRTIVNEKNVGLGKTRERGIANSEGEYILFVDSDDYIKRDYIEQYYNTMQKEKVDVVVGGYIRDTDGKLRKHSVSNSVWSIVTYPIACAKMFRKAFLVENNIGFSEIRCGEDIFFSLAVFYNKAKYKVMDYCGYYYYFNRASITGSMNYEKNHEAFVASIYEEFMKKYDLSRLSYKRYAVIEYSYISNMVNALITYGHGGGIKRMKKKYSFWMDDMKKKFPTYRKNPYVGIWKPKGQTLKIRWGVGLVMLLHRVHLDWLFFDFVSLI